MNGCELFTNPRLNPGGKVLFLTLEINPKLEELFRESSIERRLMSEQGLLTVWR
jgi:hypothetical protein